MPVRRVSTLKFPSLTTVRFDWEAIKKELSLTDLSFNEFKDSATYVRVCLQMADETWDDTFDYGVSRGFVWQDTQCGLPKFNCEKLILLITRILEQSNISTREGVIQFEDVHIRWSVKEKQQALVF